MIHLRGANVLPAVSEQRAVHVILKSWEYKSAAEHPGHTTFGKCTRSESDVIMLRGSTTYAEIYNMVQFELRLRKFSDPTRFNFIAIHVSDKTFSKKLVEVTTRNWQACYNLLMENRALTLRVESSVAPLYWNWESARKAEQEERVAKEAKRPKCVVQ